MSTITELRAAARRLELPPLARMSVLEADEARRCTGCTASYQRGVRVVRALRDCPVHSTAAAAAYWAGLTVDELVERCNRGHQAACAELDRRGVEQPVIESGPAPMTSATL
jgi:hypothetical protein